MLLLAFLAIIPLVFSATDQLIFVQTVYRHGDRTPTSTYPNDPYQESFWGVPWGELTTRGMEQQFLQGQRLRRMYVDEAKFLSPKYSRYETTIRSSDTPRCLQSAGAQMAAFYAGSPTHPTDVDGWPTDWTPLPIHTMPHDEDRVLDPGVNCKRASELIDNRVLKKNFQDYLASKWRLLADIQINSGGNYGDPIDAFDTVWNGIYIEKGVYNLTLPDWITDDFYRELAQFEDDSEDFEEGGAGFGYPEDTELLRLRGGFFLKEWIENINNAINGTDLKYYSYSSHDSLMADFLILLHAKEAFFGPGNPDYASTIVSEVWRRSDGYYLKFQYSADAYSEFVPFTRFISGCPDNDDFCSVDAFIERSKPYVPLTTEECNLR